MAVLGDRVIYRLTAEDVQRINGRRRDQDAHRASRRSAPVSAEALEAGAVQPPDRPDFGLMGHVGNPVSAGQQCAAVVVALDGGKANLQVFLDGNDTQWVVGVTAGTAAGHWTAGGA